MFYQSQKPKKHFFARWRLFWRRRKINKIILWLAGIIILGGAGLFLYIAKDLPNPKNIDQRQITESTKIYDRTGQVLLYDIHGEEKRTVIDPSQIPADVKNATVAIEDENFYHHFGLDFKGILRALFYDIIGRHVSQGGSTITQQFIKKSMLTDDKTITRKFKEAILAVELEMKYSKTEILSFYLNQVPYGSNAYGIEAAAQTFFNKPAKDLDLAQSALLAALPNAPTYFSPFGSHPETLKARQELILDRMAAQGFITKDAAAQAKKEKLDFVYNAQNIKAPHFVMYVKEYLEQKYGADYVEKAGLKVYTTLDWDMQQAGEKIISEGAQANEKKYGASNAALVAVDPKTGQILTMVGSRDYFDIKHDGNVNVTIRPRQPGSSFKPFAYVTAFEKGYTPDTVLFDLKTEFNPNCDSSASQATDQYGLKCYAPTDYDNQLRGPVTARQALAQSLNIPAVQMLYLAGIKDTIKTAKEMGVSLADQDFGLSLVLGGGEVNLLDETAAYGVFATEGMKHEKTPILKIEDSSGKTLEEYQSNPQKVLEPQMARLISSILSDNAARTPVFGANSPLYFADRPVAAKTGTTNGYRDAWTLGYTPSLAIGIWVGNNNNSAMSAAGAGISAAGPLWHNFLKTAYNLKTKSDCGQNNFCLPQSPEQFTAPEPVNTKKSILNGSFVVAQTVKVNRITGALADANTPPDLIEERPFNQIHTILYYCQKDKPLGDPPDNPAADPQYRNWEAAVQAWAAGQGDKYNFAQPPSDSSSGNPANLPRIQISAPPAGQTINQNTFTVSANVTAPLGVKQVDFFLNDEYLGTAVAAPFQLLVALPNDLQNAATGSQAVLKARVYDNAYNRQEDTLSVYIASGIH